MASTDSYAAAKSNLRDNVKILLAVFAGIAGVLLAGTPFSGFGTLRPDSVRFAIAVVALAAAAFFLGRALIFLLDLLRPELTYAGYLRDGFAPASIDDAIAKAEVERLIGEWKRRKAELLPGNPLDPSQPIASVEKLEKAIDDQWNAANEAVEAGKSDEATQLRTLWQHYYDALARINDWAGFVSLQQRVAAGIRPVMRLGFLALVAIAAFAWSSGAPKVDEAQKANVVVVEREKTRTEPPPAAGAAVAFDPLLFEPDKADLSKAAIDVIGKARDHLRDHADQGLLVYAYTDTTGRDARNLALARERAQVVVKALLAPGGIAAARLFVAELPLVDHPVVTAPKSDNAQNRSVRLAAVTLPAR